MTQQNAAQEPATAPADVLFQTIFDFMLPFFLIGAGGDAAAAGHAIGHLIEAYQATTLRELDLVGRIIAFSTAATDTLGRSMRPGLSDAQILRYRASAISLSRMADQCQAALDKLQAARQIQPIDGALPVTEPVNATPAAPLLPRPKTAPPGGARPERSQPRPSQPPVGPEFGLPQMKQNISLMIRSLEPQGALD